MAVDSYIQFSLAPNAPRIFARNVQTVEFRTIDAQLFAFVTLLNRDDSVQTPVTIGQPAADAACAAAGFLPFAPAIGFFNPYAITHYEDDGTITTIYWTSNKTDRYTSAAVVALFTWAPPVTAGVFEAGSGLDSVQQAGVFANSFGDRAFSFAPGASAARDAIAMGVSSIANNDAIALGNDARASRPSAMAIGSLSLADGIAGQALGFGAEVNDQEGIALGYYARSFGAYAIAQGTNALAFGLNAIGIGQDSDANDDYAVAIGFNSRAAANATAMGDSAFAAFDSSVAIGTNAEVFAIDGVAIGQSSLVTDANSVSFQGLSSQRANCVHVKHLDIEDGRNIYFGSSIGTTIGQIGAKLAFYGTTPIVQPLINADFVPGDTLADTQAKLQAVVGALKNLGLIDTI